MECSNPCLQLQPISTCAPPLCSPASAARFCGTAELFQHMHSDPALAHVPATAASAASGSTTRPSWPGNAVSNLVTNLRPCLLHVSLLLAASAASGSTARTSCSSTCTRRTSSASCASAPTPTSMCTTATTPTLRVSAESKAARLHTTWGVAAAVSRGVAAAICCLPHRQLNRLLHPPPADHFQHEHYLCPHPACLEKKFIVFSSEQELKTHTAR